MSRVLLLLACVVVANACICGAATITAVKGTAEVKDSNGVWKPLSFGSEIPDSATVQTKSHSSADVLLPTGVVVELLDDAQATLTVTGAATRILLIDGKLQIKITPRRSGDARSNQDVRIIDVDGNVVWATGTVVLASRKPGSTIFGCLEGDCVCSKRGGAPIVLPAPTEVEFSDGQVSAPRSAERSIAEIKPMVEALADATATHQLFVSQQLIAQSMPREAIADARGRPKFLSHLTDTRNDVVQSASIAVPTVSFASLTIGGETFLSATFRGAQVINQQIHLIPGGVAKLELPLNNKQSVFITAKPASEAGNAVRVSASVLENGEVINTLVNKIDVYGSKTISSIGIRTDASTLFLSSPQPALDRLTPRQLRKSKAMPAGRH